MNRVAIVGGYRTPFVKAGTSLARYSFLELGMQLVTGTIQRLSLDPSSIGEFVFGTVLLDPRLPNFAREIIVRSGLPLSIPAHAVSNNCISGLVAATVVAEAIKTGRISVGLAGGSESMSRPALAWRPEAEAFFLRLARARSLSQKVSILLGYRPSFLLPIPPSPKEPSTGLTMGQHCEISTKEFTIARAIQDRIALASHHNAARAQQQGLLAEEILPIGEVTKDNLIRGDTTLEKLSSLKPVFDRSPAGSITAGNSSALTDGASVVCMMSEAEAVKQGREILAFVEDIEYAAIAPKDGLLMAPGLALPRLLYRNKLSVDSVDRFEIHEAFGAQVAANLKVWKEGWSKFPELRPIGEIPAEKMNVNGGSIAIGHPFAATGGRLMLSAARELQRSGKKTAILSVCAAGGMGCAMLLRRD
ncbi:MAG: acetyl-CoA C-acyltransferase [Proteobacteria bacterium]|nr:acetyl-CoA C-acyltransferase [Pseudomonadota bacterium]